MKQHIVISFIQNGVNFPNFVNGKWLVTLSDSIWHTHTPLNN